MSRYITSRVQKDDTGTRKLSTTIIPTAPLTNNDLYIQTTGVERLDKLAKIFYEDSTLWWILSVANPDLPNDSLYPTLGFQLRIPSNINQILRDFDQLNS
jgi:hypothetical protein